MAKTNKPSKTTRYAVIRVRGVNNCRKTINDTCKLLNVAKLHNLTFIDDRPSYAGMLQKAKDWVTWGEVTAESVTIILSKWGRLPGNKKLTDAYMQENTKFKSIKEFAEAFVKLKADLKDIPNLKPFFRLHPPRKGYGRKGIKYPYTVGGALGYRGETINQLITKMT
jgi:large subunit ribosomal protein L30